MTLSEFLEETGFYSQPSGSEGVRVFTRGHMDRIFMLQDYRVLSAVSGPAYILIPR